jgi:hypothetical protein
VGRSYQPVQWMQPIEYRFGIIDFFQKWTIRKRLESFFRQGWQWVIRGNPNGM